jgi:hypothetical protein
LGYQGELTIIAVVVSVAALIMLLPISGEPNFGPLATQEGRDVNTIDETLTSPTTN